MSWGRRGLWSRLRKTKVTSHKTFSCRASVMILASALVFSHATCDVDWAFTLAHSKISQACDGFMFYYVEENLLIHSASRAGQNLHLSFETSQHLLNGFWKCFLWKWEVPREWMPLIWVIYLHLLQNFSFFFSEVIMSSSGCFQSLSLFPGSASIAIPSSPTLWFVTKHIQNEISLVLNRQC